MNKRHMGVRLAALVTLGSGLLNLYSLMGRDLPERIQLLREVFPLEFLHLFRFLTLLIGFALVISSVNIYKRKKRAYQLVSVLAGLSIVFHLTKGLDYEEALFSFLLLGLLFWMRREFTVKSSVPDWRSAFLRLALALLVGFGYGVAGFWLLDTREFGINFTIGDAIHRTFLILSFAGDPQLVAHTRYARWFLDSLDLMTLTLVSYAGFELFRPVLYQYRTLPHERDLARDLVGRFGRSSLDFFKYWPDKAFFFSPTHRSFIAYRVGGGYALALGDPVGPEEEIETTIRDFEEFCKQNDWRVAFHQTLPDFLPLYQKLGFRKLKIGDAAVVDLTQFSLDGKPSKKMRSRNNQLEKQGIRFVAYQPPLPPEALAQAKEVSEEWLEIPGRRERTFSLDLFEESYVRSLPLYAALDESGKMLAFLNAIPSSRPGEATTDLMRHRKDSPGGIMDYLFCQVFRVKKEEGLQRFNMGMAPMSGFQEKEDASVEERAVHYFMQQLNFLFSYEGLRFYKAKFATFWEPRYLIYRNVLTLPRVARALLEVSELHA